jgi:hypothetical protein
MKIAGQGCVVQDDFLKEDITIYRNQQDGYEREMAGMDIISQWNHGRPPLFNLFHYN